MPVLCEEAASFTRGSVEMDSMRGLEVYYTRDTDPAATAVASRTWTVIFGPNFGWRVR